MGLFIVNVTCRKSGLYQITYFVSRLCIFVASVSFMFNVYGAGGAAVEIIHQFIEIPNYYTLNHYIYTVNNFQ